MKDFNFPKEIRRQGRLERLGTNSPRCGICGETDDRCLEEHHIEKRKVGDTTILICRNCHRKLTDDQKDHPKASRPKPPPVEVVAHALLGIADLLVLIAEFCKKYATQLLDLIITSSSNAEGSAT